MTKTNLVLILGGALAYALSVADAGDSFHARLSGERLSSVSGLSLLAWEQPPGVPPTGSGPRPKRIQQIAWEQPPGVPPTGSGPRPKRSTRSVVLPV